jgi:hypothetical protein
MIELLIETVQTFGFPVFRQGSLSKNEKYPESFFTFWNNSAEGTSFYDNDDYSTIWDFDLNFYSTDPIEVNKKLLEAKVLLKEKGFIVPGKGYDVYSDEKTHTGRGINVVKIERKQEE